MREGYMSIEEFSKVCGVSVKTILKNKNKMRGIRKSKQGYIVI